ncbi:hypothetical protein TSUD_227350 [Trifolium subterraneum]|uniref:Uncharacterized protein n=1 Tax=Trifolium subterraneum TaxID=3900 RepID=A0A2Z6MKH9_TRISU|nr:hypothetical protein TSUD_227350 [Trifolium subterraneum]
MNRSCRDLQRLSGNTSSRVGYMSSKQIRELSASHQSTDKINDEILGSNDGRGDNILFVWFTRGGFMMRGKE